MKRTNIVVAAILLAAPCATAAAQSHPLFGTWAVEYAAGMRNEDGVITPVMQKGVLTLEAKGDSITGKLVADSPDSGPNRPPTILAAKRTDGSVSFETKSQVTINMDGEASTREVMITWTITAIGDALDGKITRRISGMEDGPGGAPQPMKGTRVK